MKYMDLFFDMINAKKNVQFEGEQSVIVEKKNVELVLWWEQLHVLCIHNLQNENLCKLDQQKRPVLKDKFISHEICLHEMMLTC